MTRKEYILSVIWPALDFKFAISGPDGFKVADFQAELKKHGLPDPIVDDTRKWTKNPRDIFVTEKHLEITKAAEPLLEGKDPWMQKSSRRSGKEPRKPMRMYLTTTGGGAPPPPHSQPLRALPTATAAHLLRALPTATAAHLPLRRLRPSFAHSPRRRRRSSSSADTAPSSTHSPRRRRRTSSTDSAPPSQTPHGDGDAPPPPQTPSPSPRTPHGDSGAPASPLTPPPPAPPPAKKARGRPRKTASVVGQKRKAEDERVEGEPVVAAKRQKNPVTPRSRTTRATAGPRTPSPAPIQGRMINCFFYPIGAILPVDYAWEDEYKPVWRKPARALALYD
ncbi:hypothetical protein B0H17DRAFT_1246232 [Mycena rosella]|uniref:Uncharacterized protein n=1 Tax=Mycena rosella TaxID=1033263 RepID=A0AAD7CYL4_MYCRO|nr:hypothetical protein B0H17DRAFT_1246232 [Mycena rosella]